MTKMYTKQCVCSCFNGSFKVSTDQLSEDVSKCSKEFKSKHLTFDAKVKFWMYHTFDFVVIVRPVYFVHLSRCWIDVAMLFELPNWGNNKKAIRKSPETVKKEEEEKSDEKMYISNMLKWSKDSDKNFIKFV